MADGVQDRLDPVDIFRGCQREPPIPRVAADVPNRSHRLRALGNAWVSQAVVPALLVMRERCGL